MPSSLMQSSMAVIFVVICSKSGIYKLDIIQEQLSAPSRVRNCQVHAQGYLWLCVGSCRAITTVAHHEVLQYFNTRFSSTLAVLPHVWVLQ